MAQAGERERILHAARMLSVVAIALCAGCAPPSLAGRTATSALQGTATTRLGRATTELVAPHPGESGVHPLAAGEDAFAARGLLAAAAERSIDAQYYIWHDDVTGRLLLEALCQAADRGVRVRLLLDDNNTAGLDPTIAAVAAHPNVEVRLFNPLVNRQMRWTNFLFDFSRINHRMHDKSFTVDNQVTVLGGRNVGDEYFAAGDDVTFADLDVIAVGPVVQDVSGTFDRFWNSASSYPAASLVGRATDKERAALTAHFAATHADPRAAKYIEILRHSGLVEQLRTGTLALEWATAHLVSDDPGKVFSAERDLLLLPQLLQIAGPPSSRFDVVSPYFVPAKQGTTAFAAMSRRGVKIRVLTNSLASNDVSAVHAGYSKSRKSLLRAGVKLYELKHAGEAGAAAGHPHGSSAALHAKTFQIDGSRVFVGSFNFDPRSARLNTELGLVIESPRLALRLQGFFDRDVTTRAYEVTLDAAGSLQWSDAAAGGPRIYHVDPGTSAWRRGVVEMLSLLPIDWLL